MSARPSATQQNLSELPALTRRATGIVCRYSSSSGDGCDRLSTTVSGVPGAGDVE